MRRWAALLLAYLALAALADAACSALARPPPAPAPAARPPAAWPLRPREMRLTPDRPGPKMRTAECPRHPPTTPTT